MSIILKIIIALLLANIIFIIVLVIRYVNLADQYVKNQLNLKSKILDFKKTVENALKDGDISKTEYEMYLKRIEKIEQENNAAE